MTCEIGPPSLALRLRSDACIEVRFNLLLTTWK